MRKFFVAKHFPSLIILFAFLVCIGIFLQFKTTPPSAHAQSYSSINCPTSTEKSALQMIPCTAGTSAITNTPVPQQSSTNTNSPTTPVKTPITKQTPNSPLVPPTNQNGTGTTLKVPTPSLKPGVPVCKPETQIVNNSCQCASQQDVTTICTVPNDATCKNGGGYPMYTGTTSKPPSGPDKCLYEGNRHGSGASGCIEECNGKPVIYFYSPTTLSVNVLLDIPGFVTASIPTYPENGWQNVTVHPSGTPDGTLVYKDKTYSELYYEDETIKAQAPTTGFVIKTSDLTTSFKTYTTKLGLTPSEQNEFIAYWVPKLTNLNSPYIFFSVFDATQKDRVDHVVVTPKPTTTIAFLAYFKALDKPISVAPLQFPAVPKRVGFTMVEWGGTIDGAR